MLPLLGMLSCSLSSDAQPKLLVGIRQSHEWSRRRKNADEAEAEEEEEEEGRKCISYEESSRPFNLETRKEEGDFGKDAGLTLG